MRFVVIIPAYNEEECIGGVVSDLRSRSVSNAELSRVIVVDNGSSDNTSKIARDAGAEVLFEEQRGYGSACLAGLEAVREDEEIVLFVNGDGSDDLRTLSVVLEPIINKEKDLVLASRVLGTPEPGSLTPSQKIGNKVVVFFLNRLFGGRYTDLAPFRAVTREGVAKLSMKDRGYGWTLEMQVKAIKKKLSILEVATDYRVRQGGRSKISGTVKGTVLAGSKMIWMLIKMRISYAKV